MASEYMSSYPLPDVALSLGTTCNSLPLNSDPDAHLLYAFKIVMGALLPKHFDCLVNILVINNLLAFSSCNETKIRNEQLTFQFIETHKQRN